MGYRVHPPNRTYLCDSLHILNRYFQKDYEILNKYSSVIKCLSAKLHLCYANKHFLELLKLF